jgi:hypothetical protein
MHEETRASHQPGKLQGCGKEVIELAKSFEGFVE